MLRQIHHSQVAEILPEPQLSPTAYNGGTLEKKYSRSVRVDTWSILEERSLSARFLGVPTVEAKRDVMVSPNFPGNSNRVFGTNRMYGSPNEESKAFPARLQDLLGTSQRRFPPRIRGARIVDATCQLCRSIGADNSRDFVVTEGRGSRFSCTAGIFLCWPCIPGLGDPVR